MKNKIMSAYIVSRDDILFLIEAALSRQICHDGMSWWHGEQHRDLHAGDYTKAADIANMLWRENIASVSARYPGERSATLPGPRREDFVIRPEDFRKVLFDTFEPAQVLKSCDCFDYQSCEHNGWKDSEAKAFIDRLRHNASTMVRGYEEAEWGPPATVQEKREAYRKATARKPVLQS